MIVDASVVLGALFLDEDDPPALALLRAHGSGLVELAAPDLLIYEVTNAVWKGVRAGRLTEADGHRMLDAFDRLAIPLFPVAGKAMLDIALRFNRTAYDASYLALAEERGEDLVTGDLRLYNAVRQQLSWVRWIGEPPTQ
jgi:predicted nucleic acid-binding protein